MRDKIGMFLLCILLSGCLPLTINRRPSSPIVGIASSLIGFGIASSISATVAVAYIDKPIPDSNCKSAGLITPCVYQFAPFIISGYVVGGVSIVSGISILLIEYVRLNQ